MDLPLNLQRLRSHTVLLALKLVLTVRWRTNFLPLVEATITEDVQGLNFILEVRILRVLVFLPYIALKFLYLSFLQLAHLLLGVHIAVRWGYLLPYGS